MIKKDNKICILVVYVDDIIITGTEQRKLI